MNLKSFQLIAAISFGLISLDLSAHTLMHLALYDVKRDVEMTDNGMITRHHCQLSTATLNTSNPLYLAVDKDLNNDLSASELDELNTAAADYLITDFIVFVDKEMLASTTETVKIFPNQAGFQADVKTDLAQVKLPETTATVTIIDPAYLFPPTELTRTQPPTPVSSNRLNLIDKSGAATQMLSVETGAASSFNWKPVTDAKP